MCTKPDTRPQAVLARPSPVGWSAATLTLLAMLAIRPAGAAAQTSRVEQIANEQAEKALRLAPEQPGAGERLVARVLRSPLLVGAGGVYPWFGTVYSGTGFAAGIGSLWRQPNGGVFAAVAAGSINGSVLLDVDWRLPRPAALGAIRPRVAAQWSEANGVTFYGVGPASLRDDRVRFDYRPRSVHGSIDVTPWRWLTMSGGFGYLGISSHSADTGIERLQMPGLGETIEYGVSRLSSTIDWRPSRGYSTNGGFVRLSWNRHQARSRERSFETVETEVVQLVPLVHEQYVFAVRGLVTTTTLDPGGGVPFVLLPSVGGGDTVRGLVNRRLHDRSRAVVSGEYRWRPSRYLDMAIFLDGGTVAPRLGDIDRHGFVTAWGVGARLHGPTFTALRIELARSREGWVAVFGGGQPF